MGMPEKTLPTPAPTGVFRPPQEKHVVYSWAPTQQMLPPLQATLPTQPQNYKHRRTLRRLRLLKTNPFRSFLKLCHALAGCENVMLQTQHCAAPCGPSGWEKAWGRGLGERRRGQGTGAARTRRQGEDCCLYCFGEGQGSGALGGAGPLPLHHHWLLAAQDGAGSADGGHAQIRAVLVLSDHVPDAAESGSGVLVDGGPHVGSGRLSLAWWEKGEESPQGSVGWSGPLCPPLVRGYDLTQRTWVGAWAV